MLFALLISAQLRTVSIPVRIDPRVELLTAVFRLQGAGEFNMPVSESAYSRRLDAFLKPFRNHPAIQMTSKLRDDSGIGFDSVAWLAVHINGIHEPRLIEGAHAADWKGTWKRADVDRYLPLLGDFVRDSHFEQFLDSEKSYFAKGTQSLEALLARKPVAAWLQAYFGSPPSNSSFAIIGMLCGGGNYGVSLRYANESIAATPILGAAKFDDAGNPIYGDSDLGLILHEFSHPYVNHVVAGFPEIKKFGQTLFKLTKSSLARNAYGDVQSTMFETFTRAAENNILMQFAPEFALTNMLEHRAKGFLWESDIADAMRDASRDGKPLRDRIQAVMPVLERLSKDPRVLLERCPKVKAFLVSKPDAEGVTTIKIEFNQPMDIQTRGLFISPSDYTIERKTAYNDLGTSLDIRVKFLPKTHYTLTLNPGGAGYMSRVGYPLQTVQKSFNSQ